MLRAVLKVNLLKISVLGVLAAVPFFLGSGCSNNNNPSSPENPAQPVTFLVTATHTPTGSPTLTFTITMTPTSSMTPVTIVITNTPTQTPSPTTIPLVVFVATDGSDSNNGGPADPMLTIQAGLSKAQSLGYPDVRVSEGFYSECVTLLNGISIHGGYSRNNGWAYATYYQTRVQCVTVFSGKVVGAYGTSLSSPTTLEDFQVESGNNNTTGGSSYGVFCSSCPGLVLLRDNIQVGNGGIGQAGNNGSPGLDGTPGANGNAGSLTVTTAGAAVAGGSGGIKSAGTNISGGNGGGSLKGWFGATTTPTASLNGSAGQTGFGSGAGSGGIGGKSMPGLISLTPCATATSIIMALGTPALDGGNGNPGTNGSVSPGFTVSASGVGVVFANNGQNGAGGGGGGGGESSRGFYCPNYPNNIGPSGGSGGGGGSGGAGGTGGESGGSSVGVFLYGSNSTVTSCVIWAGNGGDGGPGGTGGLGGFGASGGQGVAVPGIYPDFFLGSSGAGGHGGDGGNGGAGGGGSGGSSVGIYYYSATPTITGNTIYPGSPGYGGPSVGFAGPNGFSAAVTHN